MKKITFLTLLFLPGLLLLATIDTQAKAAPGKKTIALNYKLSAGQSFSMKGESSSNITTEQMGQTMTVDMTTSNETISRVLSVAADGTMQIETEFVSRKQSAKSPMGDSDTDFSSWIGKKVGFSLSPSGGLSEFKGFDQLPEISTGTGEKLTGEMIQKSLGDQFFKLPDHPVKIGESWTVKDSVDIPYQGSILKSINTTTYTATEKVKMDGMECLKIDVTGLNNLSGEFEQQGTQIELTRETKSTEVVYFALDKGMYISIEATSNGSSQIYVAAASMTIPQELKSKMSTKTTFK
jgi:hypothetical protein